MLRFKNLGSGSAGNATLIEAHCGAQVSRVLIDCGLSVRELNKRLVQADLTIDDIDAVFITHEHADHVGHARAFAQRTGAQVWMSRGTALACELDQWGLENGQFQVARDGQAIEVGALQLNPFTVPHDAREPLQLRCTDGNRHLGVITDLGHASSHVVESLQGCHALLLEANHDPELLEASAYPSFLKQRVAGPWGHLANHAAADLLARVKHNQLNCILAAHLSERNNTPELARTSLCEPMGCAPLDIAVADPIEGSDWMAV